MESIKMKCHYQDLMVVVSSQWTQLNKYLINLINCRVKVSVFVYCIWKYFKKASSLTLKHEHTSAVHIKPKPKLSTTRWIKHWLGEMSWRWAKTSDQESWIISESVLDERDWLLIFDRTAGGEQTLGSLLVLGTLEGGASGLCGISSSGATSGFSAKTLSRSIWGRNKTQIIISEHSFKQVIVIKIFPRENWCKTSPDLSCFCF